MELIEITDNISSVPLEFVNEVTSKTKTCLWKGILVKLSGWNLSSPKGNNFETETIAHEKV